MGCRYSPWRAYHEGRERDIFPNEADEDNKGLSAELFDPEHKYSGDSGVNLPDHLASSNLPHPTDL